VSATPRTVSQTQTANGPAVQLRLPNPLRPVPVDTITCEGGMHSFALPRKTRASMALGSDLPTCRRCDASPIDWRRVWRRDPADAEYLVAALKLEDVRLGWWIRPLDQAATRHALVKGLDGISKAADRRLASSVGRVLTQGRGAGRPYRDGQQTPYQGNAIFYAQHALACCCRRCMRYWHGIPHGRDLTQAELAYFSELVLIYVAARLPEITETGEPSLRRRGSASRPMRQE
jgi:Domain of unknown function (DUF4186)